MSRLLQLNRIFPALVNGAAGGLPPWKSPMAISAGVHGGLFGLLAFLTFSLPHSVAPQIEAVLRHETDLEPFAAPIAPPRELVSQLAGGSTGRTGVAGSGGLDSVSMEPDVGAPATSTLAPFDGAAHVPFGKSLLQSVIGRAGRYGGQGQGIGDGIGDGAGSGSGPGFFGAPSRGTKLIYVLDCSGSMAEPHSESRTRFERLKIELVNSIGSLPAHMEFFVVFFNQNSVPMPAKNLQPATADNKRKYLEWVVKVHGGGGTDPRDAMKLAFELHPDVIYLLTDGYFDDKVPEALYRLNSRRTTIHTFCLGDRAGEEMLQQIAERNNGTYKFVP